MYSSCTRPFRRGPLNCISRCPCLLILVLSFLFSRSRSLYNGQRSRISCWGAARQRSSRSLPTFLLPLLLVAWAGDEILVLVSRSRSRLSFKFEGGHWRRLASQPVLSRHEVWFDNDPTMSYKKE